MIYHDPTMITVTYFFERSSRFLRVLPVTVAILIFKCTEGAGDGDYSCRGRRERKIEGLS